MRKITFNLWILYTILSIIPVYWAIKNILEKNKQNYYYDKYYLNSTWNKFDTLKIDTTQSIKDKFISCTDSDILDLLEAINYYKGVPIRPKTGFHDKILINQLDSLSKLWPVGLQKIVKSKIYKIYLVKDLNALGRTIQISGERFIIFLDEKTFQKKPNSSYKFNENNEEYQIWKIEEDTNTSSNDVKYCIESTMIHELGHCVGALYGVTPHLNNQVDMFYHFPFFDSLYSARINFENVAREYYKLEEFEMPKKTQKMEFEEIFSLLHLWEHSPFPTLYSLQGPYEVFAEYFYCYFHNVIQKKPFYYEIHIKKKLVSSFINRVDNNLQTDRFKIIEEIFNDLKK